MNAYTHSARFYDFLYRGKDYAGETRVLIDLVQAHSRRTPQTLLDVACGTGAHLVFLRQHFTCAGLDAEPGLLEVARQKLPQVPLFTGDMRDFDLGQTFDAVTCLFSAIGYMETDADLRRAFAAMARHVAPGGLLIVEPWFSPGQFVNGHIHAMLVEEPDLKIARMSVSRVEGRLSILDMHHLVATPDGVEHFSEQHRMGLFTHEDYLEAVAAAGLESVYNEQGLTGRGLYLGIKPAVPLE